MAQHRTYPQPTTTSTAQVAGRDLWLVSTIDQDEADRHFVIIVGKIDMNKIAEGGSALLAGNDE